jgi:hypothetical protein
MKIYDFIKSSSIFFKAGCVIVVVSLLFAGTIGFWISFKGYIDYPCEFSSLPYGIPLALLDIRPDTQIAYCLSWYSSDTGGGGIYSIGTSSNKSIVLTSGYAASGRIRLGRQRDSISVNGFLIKPSETYHDQMILLTANPWLIRNLDISIANVGFLKDKDILYASGDIKADYKFNPAGAFIMVVGLLMMFLRKKKGTKPPIACPDPLKHNYIP